MPLQTKAGCRHAKVTADMGGSDYVAPENARKRPSVPLTRLMAATIPGTSRLRMQGVYGATRGIVGIEGCGYSLIGPERPLPTSRRPMITTLPCSTNHTEGLTRLRPTASRREGGGCQLCQPDFPINRRGREKSRKTG